MAERYPPIEEHGIIGDLHTVALVAKNGTIDLMSFPRFDSPTIFARLVDHDRGGHFAIRPCDESGIFKQLYLPEANVLLTRFLSADGVAEVSDFMPVGVSPSDHPRVLVRRLKVVRGVISFEVEFAPRFDYGRADHSIEQRDDHLLFRSKGQDGTALRLRSDIQLTIDGDGAACATFTLTAGQTAAFVMEEALAGLASPCSAEDYVARVFKETVNFWHAWSGRAQYAGRWREIVLRSALALKLMVSQTHGSLVASPTLGLPEEIGGERNWDYRYTWIRDASFTVYALIRLGYTTEAGQFMSWIEDRCMDLAPDGTLQIMYGHDGRKVLTESTLAHFEGYRSSGPVRIGNGAYDQLQLDVYGELMDSVYLYNKYGEPISYQFWEGILRLVDVVVRNWRVADEGIWEVRGGRQEFLYSRLMCWVAVDRAIRLADRRSFPYPFAEWRSTRDDIYRDIMTTFWDPVRRTLVQHRGTTAVDASSLLMPMVKFISPSDPRWLSTLAVIEEDLVEDSLVYRYRVGIGAHYGLMGEEGTFTMCSFWYTEVVARCGNPQKARFLFEKMLGYANHLGLYGEELGPHGEHLGNFPQAFTHLALISAAYAIDRKLADAGWIG